MSNLPEVLSVDELATLLRVKDSVVRRMAAQHKIGYLKESRTYTFPRAAVEAYIEANTVAPAPTNPFGLTDASMRRVRKGSAA